MKIKRYIKNKNGTYDVYLDNGEKLSLYEDVILKNNLLIKKEIDDNLKNDLINKNNESSLYNMCIKYISYKMRYKNEVISYLNGKQINENLVAKIVKRLEEEGYINDSLYVKYYVKDQMNLSNNGPFKIKRNLISFKIDESLIDNELNNIDRDVVKAKLRKLVSKKLKITKGSMSFVKNKLTSYFYNLGYSKEDIIDVISGLDIKPSYEQLKKEYYTLYKKNSKKYDEEELKDVVLSKLYAKGYTKDDIEDLLNNN